MIHKTTRSILSVLLAVLLLVTSTPLTPAFAGEEGAVSLQSESGESRELEPAADGKYYISTAKQLKEFADKVNDDSGKYTDIDAELTDDIDLSEICSEEKGDSWTPIGTSIGNSYRGTFDGNGHTISGLYINSSSDNYQGLFGYVSGSGKVQNLSVSGSVSVSGGEYVGGIVGYNSSGTVTNCAFSGTVTGTDDYVGGVVGVNSGNVINCTNTGSVSVSGGDRVGGVVGDNRGHVKNCYNTGTVTGTGTDEWVGGVVGVNSSSVTNCYNTGNISGYKYVGGVVGDNSSIEEDNSSNVENCYNIGEVSGSLSPVGGVVGCNYSGNIVTGCYFLSSTAASGIGNKEDAEGAAAVNDLSELCEKFKDDPWTISDTLNRPVLKDNHEDDGTQAHPYRISTATQLKNFATAVNDGSEKSAHAKLMNNIDLSSVCGESNSWTPIGNSIGNKYTGNFDGNGKTIENLYINDTTSDEDQGLFGCLDQGGTVKDLTVSGTVSGGMYVGGVVGDNRGTVENCHNIGEVSGNRVGGVVGDNCGTVENCYNTSSVKGDWYVGGVVGLNSGTVKNCYNAGSVSGPDSGSGNSVGGVVGYNDSSASVANCYYQTGKGATVGIGDTTKDDISQTAAKSLEDFHSGEVAYLLQGTQTTPVWGQSNLTEEDSWPTLIALDDSAQTVYKVITDYGYVEQPDNVSYTNNPAEPAAPSRDGYTFDSWQKTTGEGNTITYTAKWTAIPATYTVTFDSQGGSAVNDQTVTEGQTIIEPAAPTRDGYTFKGWFTESSGGSQWNFNDPVNKSMTLYAQWTAVEDPTPTPTPDPTPSGPSTGDSTGWDDIRDELENTAKGDQITIDMGDETKVPAEIFESLAGKDVDVIFDLGDIQWSASGADIPTDTDFTDLDLGVDLDTHGIPANVINTITGEVGTVQITLAHNGEFGFTMTLTAPLGKENAGYWANLYHYDEDAEALNFEAAAKIDEDGSVKIPFTHASQYAIVIDTHSHAAVDVSDIFIDVAPNAWYKDAVQYAYDNGLMTGTSATTFDPEATTTRAMIVSILARLENVTTAEAAGFADVDDNEWYATAVNWAANVGVVNGYEDNTFRPNTAITREQLAAILMNYAAYKGYDVSARADLSHYSDADSISSWANDVLLWAVAEGLLTGVTDDTIAPQAHATRAQVAAILQRFLSE